MEWARDHMGLSRQQLVALLPQKFAVSRASMEAWQENGIPTKFIPHIAGALNVNPKWISSGMDQPDWYVHKVIWASIRRGHHPDLRLVGERRALREWMTLLRPATMHYLATTSPDRISKCFRPWLIKEAELDRREVFSDVGLLFTALNNHEAALWMIGIFPRCYLLQQWIKGLIGKGEWPFSGKPQPTPTHGVPAIRRRSSTKTLGWKSYTQSLRSASRLWFKAKNDDRRRMLRQSDVWNLLHSEVVIPGYAHEPRLSGETTALVLAETFRAAWSTEIIGPMRSDLDRVIYKIAAEQFTNKPFTLRDLAIALQNDRDVEIVFRNPGPDGRGNHVADCPPWLARIDERTILRALTRLAAFNRPLLARNRTRRTWRVLIGKPAQSASSIQDTSQAPPPAT